ncbi:MAG: PAS domain S-box protein [Chitinivibrionales bacterium]|nr:PAS domain S-box protein [Chitinivibrionales bacterium]
MKQSMPHTRDRLRVDDMSLEQRIKLMEFSVDNAAVASFWIDEKGRVLYANQTACDMLGYSRAELLDMLVTDLYPNYSIRAWKPMREMIKLKGRLSVDQEHIRKDGSIIPVEINACYFEMDGTGYSFSFVKDISVRKRAEEAIKHSHDSMRNRVEQTGAQLQAESASRQKAEQELSQRQQALESVYAIATSFGTSLQTVYDSIGVGISNLLSVAVASIAHVKQDGVVYQSHFVHGKIIPSDDQLHTEEPFRRILHGRMPFQQSDGDYSTLIPNAAMLLKTFAGVPIPDASGEIAGILWIADTASRVFDEYEIHLIEIFSRYIAQELSRNEMEQLAERAKRMQMLGTITSGVAHEVRSPLNAIQTIADALAQEVAGNDDLTPYLDHIKSQVRRLSSIMQDLLDLGRPIKREEMIEIGAGNILTQAVQTWQSSTMYKKHRVNQHINAALRNRKLHVHPVKLQQSLFNLLENACDHSPVDSPLLFEADASGKECLIRIIDRGEGIRDGDSDKIFEPFFTTRKKGTGLGLAIVKNIIQVHRGEVTLANNEGGKGACATIRLPLTD